MRVLAFEDSYDIEALLSSGNVDTNRFTIEQKWDSKDAIETIKEFKPDMLLATILRFHHRHSNLHHQILLLHQHLRPVLALYFS